MYVRSALEIAVANCPPWAALMLLRHGSSPAGCMLDMAAHHLFVTRRRQPREEHVQLLAALLQAGAPATYAAVCQLAELACDCAAAYEGLEAHLGRCRSMLLLLLQHSAPLHAPTAQQVTRAMCPGACATHLQVLVPPVNHLRRLLVAQRTNQCRHAVLRFVPSPQETKGDRTLLDVALNSLVDSIRLWPRREKDLPAARAATTLFEKFIGALMEAGYRESQDVAGSVAAPRIK